MNHDPVDMGLKLLEDLDKQDKKEIVCKGCKVYEQFGKKCWFYWDNKKFCSQHTENGMD